MKKLVAVVLACLGLSMAAYAQTPCEGPDCEKKCTKDCTFPI